MRQPGAYFIMCKKVLRLNAFMTKYLNNMNINNAERIIRIEFISVCLQ